MILGVVIGVTVAVPLRLEEASNVAKAMHEQKQYVCGLFVLPYLAEGVVLGILVGGLVGTLVGSLVGSLAQPLLGQLTGLNRNQVEQNESSGMG